MSNPFTIDSSIISLYQQGMNTIISQLGKDCVLIYPPKVTMCPNCIYDPNSKRSSNRYKTGGPIQFPNGAICPYCNGVGNISSPVEETVRMRIIYRPKDYRNFGIQVQDPSSLVKATCGIDYLPKIQQAAYLRLDSEVNGFVQYICEKVSAPKPHGMQHSKYVISYWQINGPN